MVNSMATLPFNMDIVDFFYEFRQQDISTPFTGFFQAMTFLGSSTGYFLIVLFLYWLIDKKICFRVAILLVISAILNVGLKEAIRNPRPYVTDGTYTEKWELYSTKEIEETAESFSTPSGHAQSSATFFHYIQEKFKRRSVVIFAIFMTFSIGFSRVFLGVHYLEDVILGWIIGGIVSYLFIKYENHISIDVNNADLKWLFAMLFGTTLVVINIVGIVWDFNLASQDLSTFLGLLFGFTLGIAIEDRHLNFSNRSSSIATALIKYVLGLLVCFLILFGLDMVFGIIAADNTLLGINLRYLRYGTFGFVGAYVVPKIFIMLKLSETSTT